MKKYIVTIILLFSFVYESLAHDPDFLRSTGKIYGVYGVVLIFLVILFIYLFTIDKKISKVEKTLSNE